MSAIPTSAAVLLAELTQRGFELQVRGDRLRYRPRSAMTPDLARRVRDHRDELIAILTESQDRPTETPRDKAARLIREARRNGSHEFAAVLRDAWRERVAICEIDGGLSVEAGEAVAEKEIRNMLDRDTSNA